MQCKAHKIIYPCILRYINNKVMLCYVMEQLTFRSLADKIFIFLATFGEFPATFQDFDAFIFINNSRHVAEPLDGNRTVKRFSIVPYISTLLMPIRQPNPNRSAVCVLESRVMDKLHFLFIRYAYQVSSKPQTPA